jgi:hypothetical protein
MITPIRTVLIVLSLLANAGLGATGASAQNREHLTEQEVDLVKDAQILDQRIDIFIKAAERRMLAIQGGDANSTKQIKKDAEKWGELPSGTRAELIGDIAGILDEAITNIDDVSARDEKNPLIPKALRKLAAAVTRITDQLKPLEAQMKSGSESSNFDQLMDNAESILQAANKLPPPADKKSKNKAEKPKATN